MSMELERKFHLRSSDFDRHEHLLPSAVLDLFQEVAGAHAEALGCGYDELSPKGYLWVIARTRFEVEKYPEPHSLVSLRTWPLPPSRIGYRREYLMTDGQGDILIRGTSDWFVINKDERTIASVSEVYPEGEGYCEELAIEGRSKRIRPYKGETAESLVIPQYCDIDLNGHVNNTKYADYILNSTCLGGKQISAFQIDYHKEVLEGQPLTLKTAVEENTAYATGTNAAGEVMFNCEIELK